MKEQWYIPTEPLNVVVPRVSIIFRAVPEIIFEGGKGTFLSCGGGCFVGNMPKGWGMFLTNAVWVVGGGIDTPRTINK